MGCFCSIFCPAALRKYGCVSHSHYCIFHHYIRIRLASFLEDNKKKVLVCIATSSNIEHIYIYIHDYQTRGSPDIKKKLTGEIHMNMGDCWDTLSVKVGVKM